MPGKPARETGSLPTPTYYEAAKGPKELWEADGGHTGALEAEPEEYERRGGLAGRVQSTVR